MLLYLITVLGGSPLWAAATAIGKVKMARGAATAEQADEKIQILGSGAEIFVGDILNTAKSSLLIVNFADDSKFTFRPQTRLTVDTFTTTPGAEKVVLFLKRGGIRAITGKISRLGQKRYKLRTPNATLIVHGAKFNARLCEDDCEQEHIADNEIDRKLGTPVAARVVSVKGMVTVNRKDEDAGILIKGSPLYPADHITTGKRSNVALAFSDGGRFSLLENTEFGIEAYHYQAKASEKGYGKAFFQMLKGGVRSLSGAIGKKNYKNYSVKTPVSTIGIRGTGYDAICWGDCSTPEIQEIKGLDSIKHGLTTHVWQGGIVHEMEVGEFDLNTGQSNLIFNSKTPPIKLPELPAFMEKLPVLRPDRLIVNQKKLFSVKTMDEIKPGLYVQIESGHITMDCGGETLEIGGGETGYCGEDEMYRLEEPTAFQRYDNSPDPDATNLQLKSEFSLLNDGVEPEPEASCTVE